MPTEPEIYLTPAELALLAGLAKNTVEKWGLPLQKNQGGRKISTVNLRDVLRYLNSRATGRAAAINTSSGAIDIKAENAKIAKHKARLMELEIDEAEGRLIQADETLQGYIDMFASIRAAFVALPTKIAKRLEGLQAASIKTTLKKEVDDILIDLVEEIQARGGNVNDNETAVKPKRRKTTKSFSSRRTIR